MVDYCANPKCLKPLHYLRDGTIYMFDVPDSLVEAGRQKGHRLEHYWLCGECSTSYLLERTPNQELRLTQRRSRRDVRGTILTADRAMAS